MNVFFTVEQTLELAEQIKELENVEVFEDPSQRKACGTMSWHSIDTCAGSCHFRWHFTSAVASDVIKAIRADAVDYLNLGGSMVNFVKSAAIAQAAGIPVWHGSGNDLGIMERSYLHAAAVAPNCVLASDFVGSWTRSDDLITEGFTFEKGLHTCAAITRIGL